jgi:hypothetical protein
MSRSARVWALLLLSGAVCGGPAPRAAEISDLDRQRLVAHLEMTASWFFDEVSELSPAQLAFRPRPDTWSIMEVIDHLVVVGPIYWDDLQRAVKAPPPDRPLTSRDEDILWYGIDRTNREAAIAPELPKGRLRDLQAALDAYRSAHSRLLQYARSTSDDLRRRVVDRQGCDAYQWALLISTHEQRHILQIREIKRDPQFPPK